MEFREERPSCGPISPFFIVRDVLRAVEYYKQLGFELRYLAEEHDPFFAIVGRNSAQILLKAIDETMLPQPNHTRHPWARWDAYIFTDDPDAFAAEFASNGVKFHKELADSPSDGLRGFELRDNDGYILFFGRPAIPS